MSETPVKNQELDQEEDSRYIYVIIRDGLILIMLSACFVGLLDLFFSFFKPKENKTENIATLIIQNKPVDDIRKTIDTTIDERAKKEGVSTTVAQHEVLNDTDGHDRTVLMMASYVNLKDLGKRNEVDEARFPIVQLLLSYDKGSLQDKDKDGWTALFWATWSGLPLVSGELLNQGATINDQDRLGNSPLMIAARMGNTTMVQLLLDNGANRELKNSDNMTAEDIATMVSAGLPDVEAIPYLDIISLLGSSK